MEQNQPQPPVFNPQSRPAQPMPQYQPRVTAAPQMTFVEAVKTCLRKYCDFSGRARRSEYWWFVLFNLLASLAVTFLLSMLASALQLATGSNLATVPIVGGLIVWLLLAVPQCAVLARRMHDTGRGTGWAIVFAVSIVVYYLSYFCLMWAVKDELMTGINAVDTAELLAGAYNGSIIGIIVFMASALLTMVMGLITLIFSLMDSHVEANKYGPSPKYSYQ